jgi:hypothetical protein
MDKYAIGNGDPSICIGFIGKLGAAIQCSAAELDGVGDDGDQECVLEVE